MDHSRGLGGVFLSDLCKEMRYNTLDSHALVSRKPGTRHAWLGTTSPAAQLSTDRATLSWVISLPQLHMLVH